MRFLDAAAELVSVGFKVLPVAAGSKLPLIPAWQKVASDDADIIAAWHERWPKANIGVATGDASGVAVLDLDVKDKRSGFDDLEALTKAGKALPPCPVALTPSGG